MFRADEKGSAGAWAPLAIPGFRAFWVARTVTLLGNTLAPVAVAFAVLHLGGSAADLGLVLAARHVPQVLLLLFGGVLSDRCSRQQVLVIACVGSGLVQALAAGLLIGGVATIVLLAAVEALHGAVSALTMPALAGVVPLIVPRAQWRQANALTSVGRTGAVMAGPALGGIIVATVGPGWGLALDAATFLLAAVLFARLGLTRVERVQSLSTRTLLRAGWREFSSRTWLWVLVLAFVALNAVFAGAWVTLGPVVADDTIGPEGWGFALAAMGAGMLTASLLLLHRSPQHPLRLGMVGALLFAVPITTLAFSPSLATLLVAAFIGGIGFDLYSITWDTAVQEHIPTDVLSRVQSYSMLGHFVAIPVGTISAGTLAEIHGTERVILTATITYVVVATTALLTPAVWRLPRLPGAESQATKH